MGTYQLSFGTAIGRESFPDAEKRQEQLTAIGTMIAQRIDRNRILVRDEVAAFLIFNVNADELAMIHADIQARFVYAVPCVELRAIQLFRGANTEEIST